MARKTAGTVLYTIDPADDSILVVGCVTGINGIDTTVEELEDTCLSDTTRTYMAGLATPGNATFDINFDPQDASHVRLHQLKVAGTSLPWAIGFEGDTAPPTVETAGVFDLPTTRDWLTFEGFMNSFPFNAPLAGTWSSTVGIRVSGEPVVTPATT